MDAPVQGKVQNPARPTQKGMTQTAAMDWTFPEPWPLLNFLPRLPAVVKRSRANAFCEALSIAKAAVLPPLWPACKGVGLGKVGGMGYRAGAFVHVDALAV